VTSYPDKIYDALYASVSVLRELRTSIITDRDLQRAKRTLLTRHESDLKSNVYWLGLLTHLQNGQVRPGAAPARARWPTRHRGVPQAPAAAPAAAAAASASAPPRLLRLPSRLPFTPAFHACLSRPPHPPGAVQEPGVPARPQRHVRRGQGARRPPLGLAPRAAPLGLAPRAPAPWAWPRPAAALPDRPA
jgi:hypothetical protein